MHDENRPLKKNLILRILTILSVTACALIEAPVGIASASDRDCPDVEIMFARGTFEPPGVGRTGQAFVDMLSSQIGAKAVDVYPVDYPATADFPTAVTGVGDAASHIQTMASRCPTTKMVLGGYSQGAAVIGFVTANTVPAGVVAEDVPNPMPPSIARHVAAVVLFGKPSKRFMSAIGEPEIVIGPLYAPKTQDLCVLNDPVCSDGLDLSAHSSYVDDGLVDQAATFAASRIT